MAKRDRKELAFVGIGISTLAVVLGLSKDRVDAIERRVDQQNNSTARIETKIDSLLVRQTRLELNQFQMERMLREQLKVLTDNGGVK